MTTTGRSSQNNLISRPSPSERIVIKRSNIHSAGTGSGSVVVSIGECKHYLGDSLGGLDTDITISISTNTSSCSIVLSVIATLSESNCEILPFHNGLVITATIVLLSILNTKISENNGVA